MLKTLHEEMDDIARMAVDQTLADESEMQKLYMLTGEEVIIALLAVGPGTEIARTARLLVYQNEPRMAVLETEGWSVFAAPNETDPDRLAVMRGDKRPSQIPEHKRDQMLILYGESAEGEVLYRLWKILQLPNGLRDLAEINDSAISYESRFNPLFVVEDMERKLRGMQSGDIDIPEDMREMLHNATKNLSVEKRREIMRKVVGNLLNSGGGGTTVAWSELQKRRKDYGRS